ncbi:rhodanese-like domain-containing protein [Halobacillus mangrovi]|uniref:Rhodanese n=1 Tax=Halobacillus mangrovi TaxID=402384 RepID=A0A1W5ZR70_9BACI|nr:rhodanese-like domain-containing protein [Halobacillus mangrovi]ARI75781.1 rhodanese [Halobacillus mangrovi]
MESLIQWIIIIGIAIFVAKRFMPAKGVESITSQEAQKLMKEKNVQFIDVRTPGEFRANHRKPFKNIPLSDLVRRSDEINREDRVVLVCQSGMRSTKAAKLLRKQGFKNLYNVKGGMGTWV